MAAGGVRRGLGRGRARAAGVGASVALHALVLSWLAVTVLPRVAPTAAAPPPDIQVDLVRAPPLRQGAPRPAAVQPVAVPLPSPALAARRPPPPVVAPPAPTSTPRPPDAAAPTRAPAAAPPSQARGPGGGPAGAAAATGRAGGAGAGPEANLGGLLRATVGCSHDVYMRLSAAERERCDVGFATAKGVAPGLADDKLAQFSAQALRDEKVRARKEGVGRGGFVPCDTAMVGSNLGIGCLPADASYRIRR